MPRKEKTNTIKLKIMRNILVTGGAGFIGSHLCRRLVADGNSVVASTTEDILNKIYKYGPIINFVKDRGSLSAPVSYQMYLYKPNNVYKFTLSKNYSSLVNSQTLTDTIFDANKYLTEEVVEN